MPIKFRSISDKRIKLYSMYRELYSEELLIKMDEINLDVANTFRTILSKLVDLLEELDEDNFCEYFHSALHYVSREEPEFRRFVDEDKVIDIKDEIEKIFEFIKVKKRLNRIYYKYCLSNGRMFWYITNYYLISLSKENYELFKEKGEEGLVDEYHEGLKKDVEGFKEELRGEDWPESISFKEFKEKYKSLEFKEEKLLKFVLEDDLVVEKSGEVVDEFKTRRVSSYEEFCEVVDELRSKGLSQMGFLCEQPYQVRDGKLYPIRVFKKEVMK